MPIPWTMLPEERTARGRYGSKKNERSHRSAYPDHRWREKSIRGFGRAGKIAMEFRTPGSQSLQEGSIISESRTVSSQVQELGTCWEIKDLRLLGRGGNGNNTSQTEPSVS